jgi:hypothetical protein
MIKIDDFLKTGTPMGIAFGIGATVLATAVIPALPVLAKAARPMARAAIKSVLLLAARGRELIAEVSEELEDVLAETKAELMRENTASEDAEFSEVTSHQDDL